MASSRRTNKRRAEVSEAKQIDPELEALMIDKAERVARLYPELKGSGLKPSFVVFDEEKGEQK